jgi:hypothetical protein
MFMSKLRLPVNVLVAVVLGVNGQALAQGPAPSSSVQQCALAYENSQEHRRAGAISSARLEFARCEQDDCPAFIRSDCSRWSKEAEADQPTLIFSAKSGTRDMLDVQVSTGGRVLVERLSERTVELDPGEYDFLFEATGGGAVVQHAVIAAGDKNRLVRAEFAPAAPVHTAAARPRRLPAAAPTPRMEASQSEAAITPAPGPGALPWLLFAVGAASVGAGGGLSVWGRSSETRLRDTCSPNCTDSQVRAVRTKYLLADVSFGVGLASLSAAAYFFLRQPAPEHVAKGPLPLTVVASPRGVLAAYGASF